MTHKCLRWLPVWLMIVTSWLTAALGDERLPFDLVLQGGRVVDGSGTPWYVADVGIRDGRITKIGQLASQQATRSLDVQGLIVAPGFIDMMGQSATSLIDSPETALNLLTQGITTINCGEGSSAAPLSMEEGQRAGWTTMHEYLALLDMQGLPVNVVHSVGHTQVRRIVLGDVDRRPSEAELLHMQALVREAMQAGAIGVSTALIYPPAVYAPMEEIAALVEIAGNHGGSYYTHMRNEGDQLLEAVEEALEIGRRGHAPVHIFHLKAAGRQNWGKLPQAIATIQAARATGQQVTADIYPYVNNGLGIAAFIHPRHFADGSERLLNRLESAELRAEIREEMETTTGWENWYRHVGYDWHKVIIGAANASRYQPHVGQSLADIAAACQEEPWETFFELVRSGAFALPESMSEANKLLAMQQEFISFCTDVGPAAKDSSSSHPRAYGAFPRMLSRYARDLGVISLEQAISQASAVAANDVHVFDRGRIAEGLAADLVVFDLQQLADRATFAEPHAVSQGVRWVLVAGQIVLEDKQLTSARPGRVLRGPGYVPPAVQGATSTGSAAGEPTRRLPSYDALAAKFIQQHHVPGMAIAVTDQGRLVHAAGYGCADLATREPVQPQSLFRIASISKPITAVAILQLVEQGKLQLSEPLVEVLDLQQLISRAGTAWDPRWQHITIEHLLQHRGGWDRSQSFDAMFQAVRFANLLGADPPANQWQVIEAMLREPLDFSPGQRYAYSNFGYNLLGRVIETRSGEDYEAYVREHVLAPLGIHDMRLGASRLEGRATNEVRYYQPGTAKSVFATDLDQRVAWPYGGWHLEAMDSHGGWLASAVDLARFAAAFDDPANCPILSAESIATMYARPTSLTDSEEDAATYYSLGWQNRELSNGRRNHWHTGSLSGTATVLIRRHDGRNFVALLNSRVSPTTDHLGREIDSQLHAAAARVQAWPQVDLFDEFFPKQSQPAAQP